MFLQSLTPSWFDPTWLLNHYGTSMIWISLVIVFVECGLLFPFLPGDILLFFVGLFIKRAEVGQPGLHINLLLACLLLSIAAWLGNVCGYEIGRRIGPKLYERDGRIVKRKYLDQTQQFFETYGNRALVIGRFVPVVRTYITVVAGVTQMPRRQFFVWSAVGAVLWACGVTVLGYFLGYVRFLQDNIDLALLGIAIIPLLPMLFEYLRARRRRNASESRPA